MNDDDENEDTEDVSLEDLTSPPEAPPAPPELDLAPPEAPPAPPEAPPSPPGLDLLAPASEESGEVVADDDNATETEVVNTEINLNLAGSKIRPASDVDAIPGHKLVATLEESESATLSSDGDVIKQSVKGLLTLKNPSDTDRLWDIDVILNNSDYSDIEDDLPYSELEPGADQAVGYSVEGPRMLCLRERIDTWTAREQERSLSIERSADAQDIGLELEVENMSPVQLNDIVVTRTFPVQIQVSEGTDYERQGDTITWNVGRLASGETRTLAIPAAVTAEAVDAIDAGSASATYTADATLSGMNFDEVDAHCRGFSYMVVDEDERPDNYRCQAVFENRSSFTVDLTKLTVSQTGADENLFEIEDVEEDVLPDGRWESDVKVVHSMDKPTFSQELLYTVLPRVSQSTEGTVTLQSQNIEVLEADIEKTYSLDVLRHYRRTELDVEIEIENTGSAVINLLRIHDDVPGLFESPDSDNVKANIGGKDLNPEQVRIEVHDGIKHEKNRISPDGPGFHMEITIGQKGPIGLKPGQKMSINYPLVAPDPSPANDVVAAPARIDFSAERYGPIATRSPNVSPVVRVTHRKVNYDSGKEVFPAGGAGRYEAMIMFNNRADSALQDVVIHDIIPGAFELLEWKVTSSHQGEIKCEMGEDSTTDGKKMSWNIGTVGRGERIEVTYEFKGDPETGFKVSDAQEIHGIDVGAEIEDDGPTPGTPVEEPVEEEDEEIDVPVDELPDNIKEAVEAAVPGGDITEAELEMEDGEQVYEVTVEKDGQEFEVEVSKDGDVLEVELEEEEDGDSESEDTSDEDDQMDAALAKITGADTNPLSEERKCPICSADVAAGMTQCPVCSFAF
ncbi:MAG: PepSY domain-containing protein, partial [Candidatus Thermoplasmatota archaeon]|nr:PepSY domain-containing protein [Candidatus Thermoplasmatota archaeon]